MQASVFRLSHIDIGTASLEKAQQYYGSTLGLTQTESSRASAYFSVGLDHHNLCVHETVQPRLDAIGLQVSAGLSLVDLQRQLSRLGIRAELKSDARPGVPSLLQVEEVGGHTFQLISEMKVAAPGFGREGVAPLRLGHLAIATPEPERMLALLGEGLGFVTTDWFEDLLTFVTCNSDHHVLNIIEAPVANVHHLAFQLDGRDHQFRACDQLAQRGMPTLWGPARHTAGHNVASYHHGADNMLIELYNDMDVFLSDVGYCEPRPWHGDLPQRPKHWSLSQLSRYDTRYEHDLAAMTFGT